MRVSCEGIFQAGQEIAVCYVKLRLVRIVVPKFDPLDILDILNEAHCAVEDAKFGEMLAIVVGHFGDDQDVSNALDKILIRLLLPGSGSNLYAFFAEYLYKAAESVIPRSFRTAQ